MENCQFFNECLAKMTETVGIYVTEKTILSELETACYPCASHGGSDPLSDRKGCFDCPLEKPCPEQLVHAVNYTSGCHLKPRSV